MMTATRFICAIFVACLMFGLVSAQRKKSTLLPASEAKKATNQCSRPSPEKFSDTWQPTESDIKEMESRFSEIKKLRAECCIQGQKIEDPEEFYMQYVGIVVGGKKLIYISAFADDKPPEYWKEQAVNICDGGNEWGVLYDPEKKRFFDLAVNGVG